MTPLDTAHATMEAAPDDDAARLRFYAQIADDEMFLLLERDAAASDVTPQVFDLEEGPVVMIFDSEDRLAEFTGVAAPYAALPGRVIVAQLAGQGIGIGLNLGVAPSSFLIAPQAVDWLAETLIHAPVRVEAKPVAFQPPGGLPEALIAGLEAKLAQARGLAVAALLARVTYEGGRAGHMLAFVGVDPGAQDALARAAAEALIFSGVEAGEMDVVFLAPDDPALAALGRVARPFDLALPVAPDRTAPMAPGSDPARPPILR